jgi:site-specific recombinase XerD
MGDFGRINSNISAQEGTLEQALADFVMVYLPAQGLEVSSRGEYQADAEQFIRFVEEQGITQPQDITLAHLNAFLTAFEQRPIARRKAFALKVFFHYLKQAEILSHNPADALIPPPHDALHPRVLTIQERRALLGVCAYRIRDRALIEVLLATGITLAEVARLQVFDYGIELQGHRGQLVVQGRGYKHRSLPLDYEVCQALDAWLTIRPPIDDPALFVTRFEKPLGERSVQHIVQWYLKQARISNASVSALRHTYAVHCLSQGMDLAVLQQRLGLANRQDTALYVAAAEALQGKVR